MHTIGDAHVADHAGAATEGAAFADARAAGHAGEGGHRSPPADSHVVGDLDQVVELHAVLDHGIAERAAVDAGVGADLHVVADAHGPQLLDLHVAVLAARREAEAVGANDGAAVDDAAGTDHALERQGHARMQPSASADARRTPDEALCPDFRTVVDLRAGLDDRQRADADTSAEPCAGIDHRARVHPGDRCGPDASRPPLGQAREIEIGIGRNDRRTAGHRFVTQGRRHDHAACRTAGQLGAVARIGQKGDGGGVGVLERPDAGDVE